MRILFISRTLPYLGGREVIVDNLIDYFRSKNKVMALTPDNALRRQGLEILHTNLPSKTIYTRVKRFRPGIISCHTFYLADKAIELSKALHVPLIFTFHGVFIRFYGKDYRSIIRRIYKNSDCVVTVSKSYQRQLAKFVREKGRSKIELIRNGIARKERSIKEDNFEKTRRKLSVPLNKHIVIIPVRLNKVKGVEYVIQAARKMKCADLLFVISSPVGRKKREESKLKQKLLREVERERLPVVFKNYSHLELQTILPVCDACLMPSLIEGMSLSILESMRAGLIVIATKVGGTPEIIRNGKDGFLINARSPQDIVRTVDKVLGLSAETKNKIIKSAKERVRDLFAEKKMFLSYTKLFNRVRDDFYQK